LEAGFHGDDRKMKTNRGIAE